MATGWQTVVGTLGGVAITAIAAFVNQRWLWTRQRERELAAARREAYGTYLGVANRYFLALTRLSWALRKDPDQVDRRGLEAERLVPEVMSAKGQVDILAADDRTKAASESLRNCLQDIENMLHEARSGRREKATLPRMAEWQSKFTPERAAFVESVKSELGLAQTPGTPGPAANT